MIPQIPTLKHIAKEFAEANNYGSVEFCGKGSFKETYKISNEKKEILALKLLPADLNDVVRTEREIIALQKCNTESIGKLFDYGEYFTSGKEKIFFTIEEYLNGGTLQNKINKELLTKDIVCKYATVLINAIEHLKDKNLVHRDIKPENIMFRESVDSPILVDFGLVRDLSLSSVTKTFFNGGPGTPLYSSPEQLNNEKTLIDWRTDQFCLGIVLSFSMFGFHPYHKPDNNIRDTIQIVAERGNVSEQFIGHIKQHNVLWIEKMVQPWSVRRYNTIDALLQDIKRS